MLLAPWWCTSAFRSSSTCCSGKARYLPGSARTPRAQRWGVVERSCSSVIHNWRLPYRCLTATFSVLKTKVGGRAHVWLMTSFVIHDFEYLWFWDPQCSKMNLLNDGNTALCLAVDPTQQLTALWSFVYCSHSEKINALWRGKAKWKINKYCCKQLVLICLTPFPNVQL